MGIGITGFVAKHTGQRPDLKDADSQQGGLAKWTQSKRRGRQASPSRSMRFGSDGSDITF